MQNTQIQIDYFLANLYQGKTKTVRITSADEQENT